MARVLLTGMSGAGKTTVLDELRRRGHLTVDTDYDGWTLPKGTWDERRMDQFLARHLDVIVSGTARTKDASMTALITSSSSARHFTCSSTA